MSQQQKQVQIEALHQCMDKCLKEVEQIIQGEIDRWETTEAYELFSRTMGHAVLEYVELPRNKALDYLGRATLKKNGRLKSRTKRQVLPMVSCPGPTNK